MQKDKPKPKNPFSGFSRFSGKSRFGPQVKKQAGITPKVFRVTQHKGA